jgi:hypothetical protein
MKDDTAIAGLRMAIEAVKRIRSNDFPATNRLPYTRGARDALHEVERVCRMEIKFLKEGSHPAECKEVA